MLPLWPSVMIQTKYSIGGPSSFVWYRFLNLLLNWSMEVCAEVTIKKS